MAKLQSKKVTNKFKCSQEDLEGVVDNGIGSYELYQPQFEAKSEKYTPQWGTDLRNQMIAALNMPNYEVRLSLHKQLRVETDNKGADCCAIWKDLESHIYHSFPEETQELMCEEAGKADYRRATQDDWEAVIDLMNTGEIFIANHETELEDGGMPNDFQSDFSDAKTDFETARHNFREMELETVRMSEEKIRAYNAVYDTLMGMFNDGKKLFRHDASIRVRFTFSRVLNYVRQQRGDSTPDIPSVTGELNMVISQPDVNLGAKVNGKLFVNLNEGPVEEITGDGTSTTFINKQYTQQKIFKLLITGSITGIIELHLSDANLQDIKLHKDMKNIKELILQNNLLKTATIDDILITVNKYNTTNGVLNLIGNEVPSAAGLAAKAELEARGWVVLTS